MYRKFPHLLVFKFLQTDSTWNLQILICQRGRHFPRTSPELFWHVLGKSPEFHEICRGQFLLMGSEIRLTSPVEVGHSFFPLFTKVFAPSKRWLFGISSIKPSRVLPIGSMYGIFTYIYHENQPNVGKYTIHGSYGLLLSPAWLLVIRARKFHQAIQSKLQSACEGTSGSLAQLYIFLSRKLGADRKILYVLLTTKKMHRMQHIIHNIHKCILYK